MKQDQEGSLYHVKPKCTTVAWALPFVAVIFSSRQRFWATCMPPDPSSWPKGGIWQTLHWPVPDRWRPDPDNNLVKKGRALLMDFSHINSLRASETSLQYLIGIRALLSIFQNFFLLSVVVVDYCFCISFIFSQLCLRCQKKFQKWTQNA